MATSVYKERLKKFQEYLCNQDNKVDVFKLRKLCFEGGCPDDNKHIRSVTWKILLGYLSQDINEWDNLLNEKRKLYQQFVSELIVSDNSNVQSPDDHPLSTAPTSHWSTYFRDNEVLSQIYKDVKRLYPDISFFQQRIAKKFDTNSTTCDVIGRATSKAYTVDVVRNCFGTTEARDTTNNKKPVVYDDDDETFIKNLDGEEFHWQIVARVLFVYAKLNPGHGYVQGMNEIVGPIYYVFANDNEDNWSEYSEADTFWCFTSLMSEIRDIYNSHADADHRTGIVSMMTKLTTALSKEDHELYHVLTQLQVIKPHYYAFRWITLLLSQEFPLPDVLRIWDFLFADEHRFNFLLQMCCAMIILLRNDLMAGDFASSMKLLQNFPDKIDLNVIINKAKTIKIS